MKAICNRQHRALVIAFRQLENLLPHGEAVATYSGQAQDLSALYLRYQTLLSELADCISEYNELHHHLKVNVLAPALRQAKNSAKPDTKQQRKIQGYVRVARAI
ncbi:hypothetical protein [Sphingobacterium thalpophilum]|uniref:hypothetical protein n=1 Tax=Sphingobacterium thalpophilum TaxID=259 RepID=UPI002D78D3FB|nr:hypothetical protein [Sphingobacterium thalpophilum]